MPPATRRPEEPPAQVYSITAANQAHSADLSKRMGRYVFAMGTRMVCIVLTLVLPSPWRWIALVGAVGLPYVAVLLANAGARPGPAPDAFGFDRTTTALTSGAAGSPSGVPDPVPGPGHPAADGVRVHRYEDLVGPPASPAEERSGPSAGPPPGGAGREEDTRDCA